MAVREEKNREKKIMEGKHNLNNYQKANLVLWLQINTYIT